MTLYQLEVFDRVAKLRSFTKAAKELQIGQPTVSSLVDRLQGELGIKLFERIGTVSHLTEAGTRLLQTAQNILTLIQETRDAMEELKGLRKGKIRVGGSSIAAALFLPVATQAFKKDHPQCELILGIERSDTLEKQLLEGDLDVAIMGWRPNSTQLVSDAFRAEEIVAIAPPGHALAKKCRVSLNLIAKEPLILPGKGAAVRGLVERRFIDAKLSFTPVLEVNGRVGCKDAIKSAVANGLGIGFLPKCHVNAEVEAGRLKFLNAYELHLKQTMYIVIHKKRKNLEFVRAFVDFLKRHNRWV
ncbi:MAG TPA: LysR family transcriptional regulator [Candidatus Binatia bacterium]|jgi:DNA-binding transcriptional LysR family regulator